jgi:rhodanese-related sulfurtransferase
VEEGMKLKPALMAAALIAASGGIFTTSPAVAQSPAVQQVPLIEPAQVRGLMSLGGKLTIVDVRTPEEFAQGHINGAILMPLDKLPNTFTTLPKQGKLIVYCRSGHRSGQAVQFLAAHGYSNAVSMNGGYLAWTK